MNQFWSGRPWCPDVPWGMDADTGQASQSVARRRNAAFGAAKAGFLLLLATAVASAAGVGRVRPVAPDAVRMLARTVPRRPWARTSRTGPCRRGTVGLEESRTTPASTAAVQADGRPSIATTGSGMRSPGCSGCFWAPQAARQGLREPRPRGPWSSPLLRRSSILVLDGLPRKVIRWAQVRYKVTRYIRERHGRSSHDPGQRNASPRGPH